MHGNVYEWCPDHWQGNYEGAPDEGSAWLSEAEGARRVIRGGSWVINPGGCRSAYRYFNRPGDHDDFIGFRIVMLCSVALGFPKGGLLAETG